MRNSKHGLKALVLAMMAAALGTMAFATSAQAALPAESKAGVYLVNLGAALLATVTGRQIGAGSLLVKARDLKLECPEFHIEEGKIHSSTDALGKVIYLNCVSKSLASGEVLPCTLTTLGSITANVLFLPLLHGVQNFVLFEPQVAGGNFTTVSYKGGTECPLPLNNPVTGAVDALVDALDAVKQLLLFSEAIQLLSGLVLKYGGSPSYIDGHAEAELSGAHVGQKLGIH